MRGKPGSYVGTGSAWSPVTGLPYAVAYIQIRSGGSDLVVHRYKTMGGDATLPLIGGGVLTNCITSLNSDGFSVGTDVQVNALGVTYYYWLLGEDSDVAVVTWTGDGADNRNITSPGIDPNLAIVQRSDVAANAVFRTSSHTGDDCSRFDNTANEANSIQGFVTGGIQVGTTARVNVLGGTYHAVCVKSLASYFAVFTYAGSGVDNRDINTLGVDAEVAVVKRDGVTVAALRTSAMAGGNCPLYSATAFAGDRIQSLITGGFQVGTDNSVNNAASNYYGWVFKEPVAVAAALQGALSCVATVAGALTTSIALSGALSCPATVAGNLTTGINPKAAISATATLAGSLTTSIRLQAAISGIATLQGNLGSIAGQPVRPSCVWTVPAQDLTFVVPPVPTYEVRG